MFTPLTRFVMRTPRLPLAVWTQWAAESSDAGGGSLRALCDDAVASAVALSSPSVAGRLHAWRRGAVRDRKLDETMAAFVGRMAGRCTPFGTFAAISTGVAGSATALHVLSEEAPRLWLDYRFVLRIIACATRDVRLRERLRYRLNSSAYALGTRLTYWTPQSSEDWERLTYEESHLTMTPELRQVVEGTDAYARIDDIVAAMDPDREDHDGWRSFIVGLIEAGVLVSELEAPMSGTSPLPRLLDRVSAADDAWHDALRGVQHAIDRARPNEFVPDQPSAHDTVIAAITAALGTVDPYTPALHATLHRDSSTVALGRDVLDEIARAVTKCAGLVLDTGGPLQPFVERFLERFGTREVPLMEALDPHWGVGFEGASSMESDAHDQGGPAWTAQERALLNAILEAIGDGRPEVLLGDDLFASSRPAPPPTACALVTIVAASAAAVDAGDYHLCLNGVSPSVTLLGRFCNGSGEVRAIAGEMMAAEEHLAPDCVFADVVHLPPGKVSVANALWRPRLRSHEIVYLGGGADDVDTITVRDLLVRVDAGRVRLRSRRLNRTVVPCLGNAHTYLGTHNLPVYRFLGSLTQQDGRPPLMSRPCFTGLSYIPRLRFGRVIVAEARWRLHPADVDALARAADDEIVGLGDAVRQRLRLPRLVTLLEGDRKLPIDLTNAMSLRLLARQASRQSEILLTEMMVGADDLVAVGPAGPYHHELIVPLVRPTSTLQSTSTAPSRPAGLVTDQQAAPATPRRFAPGSAWIYVKVYTDPISAEHLLLGEIADLIADLRGRMLIEDWFFVRYSDPAFHVRLRIKGVSASAAAVIRAEVEALCRRALERGEARTVQHDTYEQETERYGGEASIGRVERLFTLDSDTVTALLAQQPADRWTIGVWSVAELAVDLTDTPAAAARLCRTLRGRYGPGAGDAWAQPAVLARRARRTRAALRDRHARGEADPLRAVLMQRREAVARTASAVWRADPRTLTTSVEEICCSLMHMHVNRLLLHRQQAEEFALYDCAAVVLDGMNARRAEGPERRKV